MTAMLRFPSNYTTDECQMLCGIIDTFNDGKCDWSDALEMFADLDNKVLIREISTLLDEVEAKKPGIIGDMRWNMECMMYHYANRK